MINKKLFKKIIIVVSKKYKPKINPKNGKIIYFSSDAQTSIVNFDTYFYPLGEGPLKVSEIQKDANDMKAPIEDT